MKKVLSLILALVMLMSLVSCGKKDEAPASSDNQGTSTEQKTDAPAKEGYEDTVYLASEENFETADPYASTTALTHQVTNMTFNTLISLSPADGSMSPELAKSWKDVNGDATVWDFELVDNAVFHDGSPFTADDVVFTWNYVTNIENVIKVFSGTAVQMCDKVEALDPYTVRFTLKAPLADFVTYLNEVKIYSKTAFEKMDPAEAGVIGTGPYVFNEAETKNGVQAVFDKFDKYWGDASLYNTNKFVYKIYGSTDTMVAALQAGEVDVYFNAPASQLNIMKSDDNLEVIQNPGAYSYYFGFNYKKADSKVHDLRVRKAISMAVDRDAMCLIAFEGAATPSYCAVTPVAVGYSEGFTHYGFDVAAAKALIEEAGATGMKLVLSYPTAACKMICEVAQSNLQAIGLDVELLAVDVKNWTAHKASLEYDLFADAFGSTGALLYNVNRMFYTGGSSNSYGYYNPDYEALQDSINLEPTFEDMRVKFKELMQFINDDLPVIPLLYDQYIVGWRNDVVNMAGDAHNATFVSKNLCDFSTICIPAR